MKKIYFNELKVAVEDQNDVMTIVTQEKVSKLAFLSQNYVHIYIYIQYIFVLLAILPYHPPKKIE